MAAKLDLSEPIKAIKSRLRNLAEDLEGTHGEAARVVHDITEQCASDIRSEYQKHRRTGNLADRVRTKYRHFLVGTVVAAAPHATIFEKGTKQRITKKGHKTGASPEHKTIAKIAPPHRERLKVQLADILRRHGLDVTG